jgi:hypothetical protein
MTNIQDKSHHTFILNIGHTYNQRENDRDLSAGKSNNLMGIIFS